MWCKAIFIFALSCGQVAYASEAPEKQFLNLKLLVPILDKVAHFRDTELPEKHKYTTHHVKSELKKMPSSHYVLIQNYIYQFKRYSQLQLSDQLAVTIGTLRAEPLGEVKKEIIDISDVFSPQMDRIEHGSDKGYGIKFKFVL